MVVHKNTLTWLPVLSLSPWGRDLRRDLVSCVQEGLILKSCDENF